MMEEAIREIEAQQAKLNKYHPAHMVGEQLKDIIKTTPGAAELVAQDLKQSGMGLTDCEKKIKAFADAHKVGNCGCCPPDEAEKIIRKFYGIGDKNSAAPVTNPENSSEAKILSFADFL
jgi:hypothetical protein